MSILALLPALSPLLDRLIDRIPDSQAREKAKAEANAALLDIVAEQNRQQVDVNKIEAANMSWFASSWRPLIGYTCACALAWQYVLSPILYWISLMAGWNIPMPPMLNDILWELMFGMLGLAGMRTFEKTRK